MVSGVFFDSEVNIVIIVDINNDGWLDLFFGNDGFIIFFFND